MPGGIKLKQNIELKALKAPKSSFLSFNALEKFPVICSTSTARFAIHPTPTPIRPFSAKFNITRLLLLFSSHLPRHPKLPAKNGIVNKAGLTPLTLACKLGRSEVFREMLELSCREFWRYSNITCSAYPLNALDTLMPDGSTSKDGEKILKINIAEAKAMAKTSEM